ncbi:ankyrin repeat domain-containing protein [Hydrogenophaga sp.]|uniref:ankyrin repeat domain-containing protein n=1 Tax=Hydrogenophaga sp. TaxID=1904254 RepID=UPI00271D10B2|nr:ankyrin repeat domain-containing protein [Hydrogenophaga sp.]MDO9436837.1 ankyrin repeat domain-containing protein [Hydrogenophaga sp.]
MTVSRANRPDPLPMQPAAFQLQTTLQHLGIDATTARRIAVQHGSALHKTLLADNAPLVMKVFSDGQVTIEKAGRAPDDQAERMLPSGFGPLAHALAEAAPAASLGLLKAALECEAMERGTYEEVQGLYETALKALANPDETSDIGEPNATTRPSDDSTSTTTTTTMTTTTVPAMAATTASTALETTSMVPARLLAPPLELSAQANAVLWANGSGPKALGMAISAGNLTAVQQLLAEEPEVPAAWSDHMGANLLHQAVEAGQRSIVVFLLCRSGIGTEASNTIATQLLDREANIDAVDFMNNTALHIACGVGSLSLVMLLLDRKADVNARDTAGRTPLAIACQNGDHKMVGMLLNFQANAKVPANDGTTPLHIACRGGNGPIVALLLSQKANPIAKTERGETPIAMARAYGYHHVVETLRKKLKFVRSSRSYAGLWSHVEQAPRALSQAVQAGNLALLKHVLAYDRSLLAPLKNRAMALHLAINAEHRDIVAFLLERDGIPPHQVNNIAALLLDDDGLEAVDDVNNNALHTACHRGAKSLVWVLLDRQADVDKKGKGDQTALLIATSRGDDELVRLLLDHGANPNAQLAVRTKETPLHFACESNQNHVIAMLLQAGAIPNVPNAQGITPLMLACRWGGPPTLELLLKHGALVNLKDNNAYTALHFAAGRGIDTVVELLLANGANFHAQTDKGETPLQLASALNRHDVVAVLKRAMH